MIKFVNTHWSIYALVIFCILNTGLRAENAIGVGKVEERTAAASALVNEGLSAFHLMLAALDRRDPKAAKEQQDKAFAAFDSAATAYHAIIPATDEHVLSPSATTDTEKADVQYFQQHSDAYRVKPPYQERELVEAAATAVGSMAGRIKEIQMQRLMVNLKGQQAIATDAIEMQRFLLSITTMIHLG